jgi:hypothetical protein
MMQRRYATHVLLKLFKTWGPGHTHVCIPNLFVGIYRQSYLPVNWHETEPSWTNLDTFGRKVWDSCPTSTSQE